MICPDGCGLDVPNNHAMPEKEPMIVKKRRSEVTTSQFEFGKMSYQQLKDSHETLIETLKQAKAFIATTDNYNDGGEPSNRLMQEMESAIAQAEGKP